MPELDDEDDDREPLPPDGFTYAMNEIMDWLDSEYFKEQPQVVAALEVARDRLMPLVVEEQLAWEAFDLQEHLAVLRTDEPGGLIVLERDGDSAASVLQCPRCGLSFDGRGKPPEDRIDWLEGHHCSTEAVHSSLACWGMALLWGWSLLD